MNEPIPRAGAPRSGPSPSKLKTRTKLTFLDILVFSLALAACVASGFALWAPGSGAASLYVEAGGQTWAYPLSKNARIEVQGKLGVSIIAIEGGHARFEDSPCANKTCVSSGAVSETNQWAACLPNQVLIRVSGAQAEGGLDAGTF